MNTIICTLSLLCTVLVAQAAVLTADQQWEAFKGVHGRKFSNIEARKQAFLQARTAVDKHNAEADQGIHTYYKHVNEFAVMTAEEKKSRMGAVLPPDALRNMNATTHVMSRATPPASMDLRTCKCLPAIQNQAGCGSCWAFAALEPMEFQSCCLKALSTPVLFSKQQLVDCDTNDSGCDGGWMTNAWAYLQTTSGVMKESDYPYTSGSTGVTGASCLYSASQAVAKVASYATIPAGSGAVAAIKQALTTYGPVPVAIDASNDWSAYETGIFSGACSTASVNHAVNIVGYGTQSGTAIWIVRNQWGTSNGDQGYWIMKQGVNQCNIEKYAQYPVVQA